MHLGRLSWTSQLVFDDLWAQRHSAQKTINKPHVEAPNCPMYCLRPSCHDTTKMKYPKYLWGFAFFLWKDVKACQIIGDQFHDSRAANSMTGSPHRSRYHVLPLRLSPTVPQRSLRGRVRDEGIAGKLIWVQLIIGLSILIVKTHTKMMPLKTAKKTPLDRNWIPFKANSCKISSLKTNHLPPLKMINIQQQKPPAPNPRRGAGKVTVPRPCSRPWRQLPTSKDCLEGMILCRCVFHVWYIYIYR